VIVGTGAQMIRVGWRGGWGSRFVELLVGRRLEWRLNFSVNSK